MPISYGEYGTAEWPKTFCYTCNQWVTRGHFVLYPHHTDVEPPEVD